MIRLRKILLFSLIIISLYSCSNTKKIHGIWLGDYKKDIYFDDTRGCINDLNELIDLSQPDSGLIKYFPSYNSLRLKWKLKNNILFLDSLKYRIVKITDDSLVLSVNLSENKKPQVEVFDTLECYAAHVRDTYCVYKKLREKIIDSDTLIACNILANKIWKMESITKGAGYMYDNYEFLNNGVYISKYINEKTKEVSLLSDCWRIESFKRNLFLVLYKNGLMGNFDYKYQILDINDSTLKLALSEGKTVVFKSKAKSDVADISEHFQGEWVCKNDTNKFYSKYISKRLIEKGRLKLFDGELKYSFINDSLFIKLDTINFNCKWYLNLDQTILIYEYPNDVYPAKNVNIQHSSILKADSESLIVELDENLIYVDVFKPGLFLNKVQIFKRMQ